ncbi:hypothetical protein AB1Y20_005617 [Prymnesium parvum]|uniref:PH domain-containing protein n=1 Tax=Prymnesium parvum TaxID=97485 RepID=A0AB34J4M7_PRYPA
MPRHIGLPTFFGDSFRVENPPPSQWGSERASSSHAPPPGAPAGKPAAGLTGGTVELHGGAARTRVLKEGYLSKTSRHMRVWRARFFVLEADLLIYYISDREAHATPRQKPKGHIPLHGSSTQRAVDPLGFKLKTPQRVYAFRAESPQQVEDWLQALAAFAPLINGTNARDSDNESMLDSQSGGSRTVTLEDLRPPPCLEQIRNTQTWTDVTPSVDAGVQLPPS